MEKIKLDIKNEISETLLITLYAKAIETKKDDPLIIDKTACEIIERLDYDFTKFKNKKTSSAGVAIRASHFDKITTEFIQANQNPIVVIVGCGLDARIQRIGEIAQRAIFYEIDIDETIDLRKQLMPPLDNEFLIARSMLDTQWMDDIIAKHPDAQFIFIIEGVLMYFNEDNNKFFFGELAQRFPNSEMHFDMLNRFMSRNSDKHDTVSKTNAVFKSGIDNEKEIEKWHPRLKHIKTWYFNDFKGYQRMGLILTTAMALIPAFRNSARIFKYAIQDEI